MSQSLNKFDDIKIAFKQLEDCHFESKKLLKMLKQKF